MIRQRFQAVEERDAALEAARAATAERDSMASSHCRQQRRWDAEVSCLMIKLHVLLHR